MSNPIAVDVGANIAKGKYFNEVPFAERPRKPDRPQIFDYRVGDMSEEDFAEFHIQREAYNKAMAEYNRTKDSLEEQAKAFQDEQIRLQTLFQDDCEATCFGAATGQLVKRKKEVVWRKAWEHGQGNPIAVWNWYQEFAEVAKIY